MPVRNAILSVGFIALFVACNINRSEDAMKLSTHVTSVNDSLTRYGKQWSDELQVAVTDKDFSQLQSIRTNMQDFIQRKILDIQTMHDVGGSENLRNAELELLQFDQDSILPKFAVFETYNSNTAEDSLISNYTALMNILGKETARSKKVDSLRDKYADANDFPKPIDPNPAKK